MPVNEHVMDNPKADRVRQVADLANRRAQKKTGKFLIEGPQSVREAVKSAGTFVTDVYVDADAVADPAIAEAALERGIYVHEASAAVMERISPDCQGIAAVGSIESYERQFGGGAEALPVVAALSGAAESAVAGNNAAASPLVAACWQARDPGNEGTMIRTADAAGCAALILVGACVNPLNPKVIRSTAGSLFHIPVIRLSEDEFFDWAAASSANVWAADIHGAAGKPPVDLANAAFGGADAPLLAPGAPTVMLFGNEARGLPTELVERAGKALKAPIYGRAESLNLASSGAVILYTLAMLAHEARS